MTKSLIFCLKACLARAVRVRQGTDRGTDSMQYPTGQETGKYLYLPLILK